jgi:gas vesicle protein
VGNSYLKKHIMNAPKILIGILAGLTAGVVIGMLIAPEKGSTLRKNLVKKGDEIADAVTDFEHKIIGKQIKPNDVLSRKVDVEV